MKTNKRTYLFAVLAVLLMAFAVVLSGAETVYAEGSWQNIGALKYWIDSDGTAVVCGWAEENNSRTELTIPASVEYGSKSYKVTAIEWKAFTNDTIITKLTVGEGIQKISSGAFEGCTSLEHITLPDTLTSIGDGAFGGTAYYNDSDNWESGVLYIGNYLIKGELGDKYTVNDGTKLIADGAFKGARLSEIMIPASVERIGKQAFDHCRNLSRVTFEAGSCLKYIGGNAFNSCHSLFSINLPESEVEIGNGAFDSTGFTSIVLPEGLECIREGTFSDCTNLTEVTIPSTVKVIEEGAFNNTPLSTIHFGGSSSQWDAITGNGKPTNVESMDFATQKYKINVNPGNAFVALDKNRAPADDEVIVTCRTHPGYNYKGVTVTGPAGEIRYDESESDGLYKFSFTMPAGEVTVTVQTEPITVEVSHKITKAANPLKIKGKTATIKYSKLKKKNRKLAVKKVIKVVKKGKGKLTYKKVSGSKKITINKKTGKVTVKKGLKKGKYKVKVKVKAAGNKNYKASKAKKVTFTIVVK